MYGLFEFNHNGIIADRKVRPGKRDGQGYMPVSERDRVLSNPTDSKLRELVAQELEWAYR